MNRTSTIPAWLHERWRIYLADCFGQIIAPPGEAALLSDFDAWLKFWEPSYHFRGTTIDAETVWGLYIRWRTQFSDD